MDFNVNLNANVHGLDKIDSLEKRINDLTQKEHKVKLSVDFDKGNSSVEQQIKKQVDAGLRLSKKSTGQMAKELASSFNISDKAVINKIKSQMDTMLNELAKSWNGNRFAFGKDNGFISGIDAMAETISKNAKIIQDKMGIYDQFYSYFKDKKIYISDELKSAMGDDLYKEISNTNIGKIVRDATKGISIDSIWDEMTNLFPEHFSQDITNQVDQVVRAFDVLKGARDDIAKTLRFDDMTSQQQFNISEQAYGEIVPLFNRMADSLKTNINSAADSLKNEFEINVKVNTESIISDIKTALSEAGSSASEPIKINLDINKSEIENQIRDAIQGISSNDTPIDIKIDINKQSLESDIQTALKEVDLPIQFRVDTSDIESQIRAAVDAIDDIQIDVHVNTDPIRAEVEREFERSPIDLPVHENNNPVTIPARNQGQTVFSALGGSVREAFQTFTLANLMQDGIYKTIDAGKQAIQTVKELNDAQLDLQMATGDSKENVKAMMDSYNALGQELGALTTEVSASADSWLRQGRDLKETNQLIKDSMVLSKIGQLDSSESTEILTATLNGFQMAANEASHINDVLSGIDLASASDVSGIGTALSKTASMANNAGVSLEKTAAIIATIKDVTQDSDETIGNAVKSILSRMNQIKAGKFVDEETGEALNDVEKVLNKVNISMRDANNQFTDSETILNSVAEKWKTFDNNTQKAVATAMAGTYQYNKFIALMDNYAKVQKFEAIANNSNGAAEEKFGNYTESLEAKTKSLKASLEALASDTLSSDVYAGFLDGAKAMSDFAKETDIVKTALTGVATAGTTYAFVQLATMLRNTITQVTNLGGGLNGLWGVLSAHPVALVTAGVTAAVGVWNAYQKSVQEAVSSAKQAGSTWEESNVSIQSQVERITELKTALDNGSLSEQEAYDTKAELLSIQQSLTDSYGEQASGIDLVNGSLDEQIAKIKELTSAQAEQFLNENQKGIQKATKEMEKERHTYLGQFSPIEEDSDKLQDIIEKYKDKGIYTDTDNEGTIYVHFKGDAAEAEETLNNFMTDIRNAEDETGNFDLFNGFSENASAGLKEANNILDEYKDLYNQAIKADLQTNSKDYGGKTAVEWLNNYADAVQKYNDAVTDGDWSKVVEAKEHYNDLDNSIQMLLNNSDMGKFTDQFAEINSEMDTASAKTLEFYSALSGEGINGYQKHIENIANEIKNLEMDDIDFKAAVDSGDIASINYLSQVAEQAGVSTDALSDSLIELGIISGQPSEGIEQTATAIEDLSSQSETLLSEINTLNTALSFQSTGKSISIDDFNSDELKDYQSALEYVNGSMQINADKAREIAKAKAEEQIATNDANKAQQQSKYMENIAEIEKLQDELRGLTDAKGENADAIQSSIDALLSENDSIVNQCSQLDILSASLREATGAYQNWLDKQNTSESGDMFDDAMGALDYIEDVTQNTDSENYGRIGRESYKAAVEFLVPDTIDSQDAEAVSSYIDSIEHYFNHDSDGNRTGLDVAEFCAKATKQGLMELDEASNEYKIVGQRTMEDFVEGLNLSLPMVQAMFGEMEEFGGEFSWADEAVKTLGDLGMAAGEAKERIESIEGNQDLNIQIDVSDIDSTEDKISTLESTISQMQNYKATLPVDSSEVDDANAVIQYCVTQKQMLEAPTVMSVDASQVSGEIGNALSLLQQFQEAKNNVELEAAVGADTSEAQAKVDSLVGEIQGLSPEIQAQLNIDSTSVDTLTASMQGITPEILVKAGVDSSLVEAYAAEEKQSKGTVTWDNNTGAVDAWAAQRHVSNGTVSWGNDISQVKTFFTATGTVNWTNTTPPSSGTHGVNGTAHSDGTAHYPHLVGHAHAKGNWGTKTGGVSLVGELGREIVVEPNGMWHTVGDNGAEFQYIPAGSIVFNHLQTESLLERGFVNGRGKSYASGTAMVTGGISVKQANIASGTSTYRGSSSNNTSNTINQAADNLSSAADSTKSASDALADLIKRISDNVQDWIEILISRTESKIEYYQAVSANRKSIKNKNRYLTQAESEVGKEAGYYKQAEQRYLAYADSVASQVGLSADLKTKVQNGTIDIQQLSEDDKSRVEAYIKWFDKAIESRKAAEEKLTEQVEIAAKKLENITDIYDSFTNRTRAKQELNNAKLEYRETTGMTISNGSGYYKLLNQQMSYEKSNIHMLQKEYKQYEKQLKAYGKKYGTDSAEYREMQTTLIGINEELWESKTALEEWKKELREAKEQLKQWGVDRWSRSSDKLSAARGYKEVADGYEVTEKDHKERIKNNNREMDALTKLRNQKVKELSLYSYNSKEYQELADEIAQLDVDYMNLAADSEEAKNAIMDIRWKPFDEAQQKLDGVINEFDTLRGLLDSETFISDTDGSFTKNGLTNLLLLQESVDATKTKMANYRKQIENLNEQYKNGDWSQEEYNEKLKELQDGLLDSAKAMETYKQSMLDMYEEQLKKRNELMHEDIDAYQKALEAKKKYHDYDKKLKSQTKELNILKAQAAALEGVSDAASKARLAQIKAQIAEQEEELEETKYEHSYELKSDGYDELADNIDKQLDKTLDSLRTNADMQNQVIEGMLSNVTTSYESTFANLDKIVEEHGLVMSNTFSNTIDSLDVEIQKLAASTLNIHEEISSLYNTGSVQDTKADKEVTKSNNSKVSTTTATTEKNLKNTVANSDDSNNSGKGGGSGEAYVRAKDVKLSKTSISLEEGKTYSLKATVSPSNAASNFTWSSSNTKIAKVSSNGIVTAVSAGSATISVKESRSSITKKCKVTVKAKKPAKPEKQPAKQPTSNTQKNTNTSQNTNIWNGIEKDTSLKGNKNLNIEQSIYDRIAYNGYKTGYASQKQLYTNLKGAGTYSGTAEQNSWMVNKLKGAGYAKGGLVDRFIQLPPDHWLNQLAEKNGDSGIVTVNPGEYILPEHISGKMGPALDTMENFNRNIQKYSSYHNTTMNQAPIVYYDSLITVNGNVDKYVVDDIKAIGKQLANDRNFVNNMTGKVSTNITQDMYKCGFTRKIR